MMSPLSTCRCCFGGGALLLYHGAWEPESVTCKECHGTGLVTCQRCNDSGWMPEVDVYGEYTHEEPCTCHLGHQVMRASPVEAYDSTAF